MMNNTKKKNFIFRMVTMLLAVFTLAVVMAFPVSASAAESPAAVSAAAGAVPVSAALEMEYAPVMHAAADIAPRMMPLADMSTQTDGDDQFKSVVEFFAKWIKRVGLLVAFVGAVMFGLAIKNNDAEQKQNGLLTLVAGFVVAAICQAIDMFGIFN